MKDLKQKLIPLSLTGVILLLDQLSKSIISLTIKRGDIVEVIGDFFRLWHVRNPNILFGMGGDWPPVLKFILFTIGAILLLGVVFIIYFKSKEIIPEYRWPLAAILGGGLGNILDRIFTEGGVIDFLDFKFYGIFGFERWPTFNIADTSIVLGCITWLVILMKNEISSAKKLNGEVK